MHVLKPRRHPVPKLVLSVLPMKLQVYRCLVQILLMEVIPRCEAT